MESMTKSYNEYYNLNTSIIRIFNTYGPRMKLDDGRVLPSFIKQASINNSITINGDGNQTRSFCYIDDLIDGIMKLINIDYNLPVNLGNDDEVSINYVANKIINLLNSSSKIVYITLKDDPLKKPDISVAKNY